MSRVGPVALFGGAAALAVVGVGLLLPPGGAREGVAATPGAATAPVLPPAAPVTDSGDVTGAESPRRGAGPPVGRSDDTATAAAADTTVPVAGSTPPDRLAGPVPDDEIAVAFAAAVPAVTGQDPNAVAQIADTARTGLVDWYADAGWQGVDVQAAVVTQVGLGQPEPGVVTASVAALWSGRHPVLGSSDRRYATVTLTGIPPASLTDDTSTAVVPGTTWSVDAIEGGTGDG